MNKIKSDFENTTTVARKKKSIALVGAPNSGKTTLYNWLTGSRFKTVNYPGATVEYSLGDLAAHLAKYPSSGLEKNKAKNPSQTVAKDLLKTPQQELGEVFKPDIQQDHEQNSQHNPQSDLEQSIRQDLIVMDTPGTYSLHPKSADEEVTLKALYENPEFGVVDGVIVVLDGTQLSRHLQLALQMKDTGFPMLVVVTMSDLLQRESVCIDFEYLQKVLECPVLAFDGLLAGGLLEIVAEAKKLPRNSHPKRPLHWDFQAQEEMLKKSELIANESLAHKTEHAEERLNKIVRNTEKIDRVLLHPVWGLVFFILIMGLLFSSIFWLAAPFMDQVDALFSWANEFVFQLAPETLWADFLANGMISSFGAAMVFVPQIFILFFGISLLEGSGYLARAAAIIDRPFSALGMSGRSFVPVLSGFACAVPAIIATRNISSARDRWITSFIIPLLTCSARLPIYALLLAFLFQGKPAWQPGFALAIIYLLSLVLGGFAAGIINKFLPKQDSSFFMMELPIYRPVKMRVLIRQALTRTMSYVKRAGPPIFLFSILIWAGTHFPNAQAATEAERLQTSYAGQVGKVLEPVMAPMGVDWRVGVGLISAFAAREVFVSSMGIVFNVTDKNEETQQDSMLKSMSEAVNSQGQRIFTVSSVMGLIVFFMIALQCMSTVAIQIRESGSVSMGLMQLVVFNGLAYVLAVLVVQLVRALGFA